MASRLEVLQHRSGGDGLKGGEGRGFRAQIRPDSNAAAEEELRREIRWGSLYVRVCVYETFVSITHAHTHTHTHTHTHSKEMFAKMEVIGQVC